MEYKTVEGHEVVVGGEYEQRHGGKVNVIAFYENLIIGSELQDGRHQCVRDWDEQGMLYYSSGDSAEDLMRPWGEKKKQTLWEYAESNIVISNDPYRRMLTDMQLLQVISEYLEQNN